MLILWISLAFITGVIAGIWYCAHWNRRAYQIGLLDGQASRHPAPPDTPGTE